MTIASCINDIELTKDQLTALEQLEAFFHSDKRVFMLKGYAGTGKTTILKGLAEYLRSMKKTFVLMTPTGRAAKVLRDQTGHPAFTIHKLIYSYEDLIEVQSEESFYYYYGLKNNRDCINTIFIIDEASMVSDAKNEGEFFRFGSGHLLTDLIAFARPNELDANNKLIFVGDPAQLPPIGDSHSKAFDPHFLQSKFNLTCDEAELKEVKRQTAHSGILNLATKLRKCISSGFYNNFAIKPNTRDIHVPAAESFVSDYFETDGRKIIIAYKNKTCLKFNLQIRSQNFGGNTESLIEGEIVIIGANNTSKDILNGEFAVITSVGAAIQRIVPLKGKKPVKLSWRQVTLAFPKEEGNQKIVSGYALENFLQGDTHLSPDEMQALYVDFKNRHPKLKPRTEEFKTTISSDEFFNCIQLKYGYAVTCHKAQGGEWDSVFIVWDYKYQAQEDTVSSLNGSKVLTNQTFFRWAYTAVTRAAKTLISLDPPSFNSYSALSILTRNAQEGLDELTGTHQRIGYEIELNDRLLSQLEQHRLMDESISIQDHFIGVFNEAQSKGIEIRNWRKNGFEIWYYFQKDERTACIKTWVNGHGIFNTRYQRVPGQSNSPELGNEVEKILRELPTVRVLRAATDNAPKQVEFDSETDERYPFAKSLFDDLENLLKSTDITIAGVQHLSYKERYTFSRKSESAVVDFEYNGKGFFGRVLEVPNKQNSSTLLADLYSPLMLLQEDHVSSGN